MNTKNIIVYIVLFLISFAIVYHEAEVTIDTAIRIAMLTSLLKGTAVLLLDKLFSREDQHDHD